MASMRCNIDTHRELSLYQGKGLHTWNQTLTTLNTWIFKQKTVDMEGHDSGIRFYHHNDQLSFMSDNTMVKDSECMREWMSR